MHRYNAIECPAAILKADIKYDEIIDMTFVDSIHV
jgi:hypothetical protein